MSRSSRRKHDESPFQDLAHQLFLISSKKEPLGAAFCLTSVHAHEGVSYVTQELVRAFNETAGSRIYFVALADLRHASNAVNLKASVTELLNQLLRDHEIVLLDCPALTRGSEALTIAPLVDGTLLVVQAERTTKEEIVAAEQSIRRASGTFCGFVLNKARRRFRLWPFSH